MNKQEIAEDWGSITIKEAHVGSPDLIDTRVRNCLDNEGFSNMGEVCAYMQTNPDWPLKANRGLSWMYANRPGGVPNFGKKSFGQLKQWFLSRGVDPEPVNTSKLNILLLEAQIIDRPEAIRVLREAEASLESIIERGNGSSAK